MMEDEKADRKKKKKTLTWLSLRSLKSDVQPLVFSLHPHGNKIPLHQIHFKHWWSNKSVRCTVSNCIPLAQSRHSPAAWRAAMAARQVKQIWFHSYLVTVRFSFSCAGGNRICLVPARPGRNPPLGRAWDGQGTLTDCGWHRVCGEQVHKEDEEQRRREKGGG